MNTQLPSIHLVVQEGTHPGQVFVIQKHTQTIGRSAGNDIPIAEPSLSRQHAQIRARPDGFVIEDLGSTNGTFVNGQRVTEPTWLRPGDTLQLGNVVTFSIQSGQPGQLPPARPAATPVPSTPYYQPPASPVPPHIPPSPPATASYPPGRLSRLWIWAGVVVVAVLIVGVVLGGLYYYLAVLRVPPSPDPTEIAQKPAALQTQQIWVEPTLTSTPTATSSPTPEPVEIAVPGLSAIVAEEGEPPQNVRQINASCNSQVEVRADEPVIINWDWRAAKDNETDYLAQWLDVAYYDVRLDGVPITKAGSFKYYRTESCGDKGECGPTLRWWVNVGILSAGPHHVTLDAYTTRAVSDGFDINPADGEPDVYGPGLAEQHFCDVNVAEVATPTPTPTSSTSTSTPTPTPTQGPTLTQMPASPLGVFQDFESESTWKRGDQPYGEFNRSTAQAHSGSYAGQLTYDFLSKDNEFVVFLQTRRLAGRPNAISSWVYGDKSGHYLNVWIKDAAGEVWQAPFGQIEHTGWQRMTAWLDPGGEWPHAHVSGPSNSAIDYPISFYALVLDDIPDTFSGRGSIYVDDLTSEEGAPPTPTPTLTPTSPSPQPPPGGHTIEISASPNVINAGGCATLNWHIENVQSAHINGEGITGPYGSKQVCPNSTTNYVLTVNLTGGGSDSRSTTVTVYGSSPTSQYDLYVRRMDFSPNPVAGAQISLFIMVATDTYPGGSPQFPATNFHWRQGDGSGWHTVPCPANAHQPTCTATVQLLYANPGTYDVEVQVDPVPNEANTNNNSKAWALIVN